MIAYRSDLPAGARGRLRTWVDERAARRVVAAPTPLADAPLVDLAEWGWEARCDTAPGASALDRFLRRRAT